MSVRRLSAWGGIVFVVLLLFTTFGPGETPPTVSDPIDKVSRYLSDNQDILLIGNIANTLASIAGLLFLVGLYVRLREPQGDAEEGWALLGLVGAIILGAVVTAGQAATSLAIVRADEQTGVAPVFHDLSLMAYTLAGILIAVTLLGFSMAARRAAFLPSWITPAGLLIAAVAVIGSTSAGSTSEVWGLFGFAGFLLFLIWVLVVSISMLRAETAIPRAETATPRV